MANNKQFMTTAEKIIATTKENTIMEDQSTKETKTTKPRTSRSRYKAVIPENVFEQDSIELKTKRVQLLVKQSLYDRLKAVSVKTGISVNELISRGINLLVDGFEENNN